MGRAMDTARVEPSKQVVLIGLVDRLQKFIRKITIDRLDK